MQKPKMKMDVPLRTEKPVMGLVSDKNFVTANAVEVILSKPKEGKGKSSATSRTGEDSMRYTQKSDYGKVPQYLTTIKSKIADEKAQIDEHIRMQQEVRPTLHPSIVQREWPFQDDERRSARSLGTSPSPAHAQKECWLALTSYKMLTLVCHVVALSSIAPRTGGDGAEPAPHEAV